jgi:ATP-dependent Clp protease ATP-binding subunit ClpB
MPAELDEVTRKLMQLEIEEAALLKEDDDGSKARLQLLEEELASLREQVTTMRAQWDGEKEAIGRVQKIRHRVEETRLAIEQAERDYNLSKAAELKHGTLPTLMKELEIEERSITSGHGGERLLREAVTAEEIAQIVGRWTGIPVHRLVEEERIKLLKLDKILQEKVVGQSEAVELVADAVLRARAGIKDPNRPIGSFLFLGPTGVGKTQLARTLSEELFDSSDNLIRIDMSEYMEKFSVSRLIGAPPGYVGYEEGGQLTEAVRRHPYSVILFDEIEKAHPEVFNLLLQILDDGRATDSQGRVIDFKNVVIIMTSNIGSPHLLSGIDSRGEINPEARSLVMGELRSHFRPEFLNRIDEVVLFKPLDLQAIHSIVALQLDQTRNRLKDRGLKLTTGSDVIEFIARAAYDPVYGARPLKRFIQRYIETPIARVLLGRGEVKDGNVVLRMNGDEIDVEIEDFSSPVVTLH